MKDLKLSPEQYETLEELLSCSDIEGDEPFINYIVDDIGDWQAFVIHLISDTPDADEIVKVLCQMDTSKKALRGLCKKKDK
jgi:hypothetical protein